MAKAQKPIILEIDGGEDYVIIWIATGTGLITTTSVNGDYEAEKRIGEWFGNLVHKELEKSTGEQFVLIQSVIIDH